jgi:hypothetical protein
VRLNDIKKLGFKTKIILEAILSSYGTPIYTLDDMDNYWIGVNVIEELKLNV